MSLSRSFFLVFFLFATSCWADEVENRLCVSFPDNGAAGAAFAGLVDGKIIVGGGENQSGLSDRLYELYEGPNGMTATVIDLIIPQALSGGASVSLESGMLFLGGHNAKEPVDSCRLLTKTPTGKHVWKELPRLPVPLAFGAAGKLGQVVYFAGGFENMKSDRVSQRFFACDLNREANQRNWEELSPLPLALRGRVVAAVQDSRFGKCFFLFGFKDTPGADKNIPANSSATTSVTPATRDEDSDFVPTDELVVCVYNPVERNWTVHTLPQVEPDFVPLSAIATGTTHILFSAATSKDSPNETDISKHLPVMANTLWAYNTVTGRLFLVSQTNETSLTGNLVRRKENFAYAPGIDASGQSGLVRLELPGKAVGLSPLNIAVMIGYFLILAGMGFYFSKRQKGTDDYFKGGKRVPWWAVGISIYGASVSAISYMAVPAKSFMSDWGLLFLSSAGLWATPFIAWFYIPRMRRYNFTSAYEYLERRYNLATRLIGSSVFILFQIVRMAVMLFLPAIALNIVTNLDIYTCIIVVGAVSIVYTMFGGIEAVIWTDVVQVVILVAGALIAAIVAITQIDGGVSGLLQVGVNDLKFRCIDPAFSLHTPNIYVIMTASFFLYIIPFASDQTIVQRYFVGHDDRDAGRGLWVNAWMVLPGTITLFLLGTVFYVFYKSQPESLSLTMDNNDSLLPWFVITQLPDGISGLLIVAIFAASMSSLSASMNSISAAYTVDFHERVFGFTPGKSLGVAKGTTLLSGVAGVLLAIAMATWDISSFWDEYNRLMGLISSGLAGVFILGLISKRTNGIGAVAGLLASFLVQLYVVNHHCVHILLYCGTGFLTAIIVGYLTSLPFGPGRDTEKNYHER